MRQAMERPVAEQIHYAVTVALGWVEEAGDDFRSHPGELPTLPAEHDMLAFKFEAVAADLRLLRDRMVRLLARMDRIKDNVPDEETPQDGVA
jgi:hypothetical protein